MNTQEALPERATINKLLVHRDVRLGSRLWHRGAYYVVVDSKGEDVREHWVLALDENQDNVPAPQ